ncbi:MAG: hypothetical protein DMG61_22970 [Acidobacteria bacterium]|nr:MAG: hypothetical protein DMG61_22970 [Acidobacteriota bacterium]PYY18765.1 MAG: hypothetical protein DMG60_07120 [Acidobacteriota bacterium]
MERHVLAAISIAGTSLDLLGGMYLAYDLLGGKHGPLRTLTRAVTYSVLYGVGFGLPVGWRFGLAAGLTNGFTLAIELSRAARQQPDYGLGHDSLFSFIRGAGFGLGLYHDFGMRFALIFAVLSTVGQIIAYSRGVRPTMQYQAMARPRITRRQATAALVRTVGYIVAALLSGLLAQGTYSIRFALEIGLVIGLATAFGNFLTPYIEWFADNLPERRLGVFGVVLILSGFGLQSVQYWVALLDVPLR